MLIVAKLYLDEEFAARLRMLEGRELTTPLVAYLRARGVDEDEADLIAMAYLAGSTHTLLTTKRALERICADADARAKARDA